MILQLNFGCIQEMLVHHYMVNTRVAASTVSKKSDAGFYVISIWWNKFQGYCFEH